MTRCRQGAVETACYVVGSEGGKMAVKLTFMVTLSSAAVTHRRQKRSNALVAGLVVGIVG